MPLEIVNSGNNYFTFDRDEGLLRPIDRKTVEGWRGISRDENGNVVRSDDWKTQRIEILKEKIKDHSIRLDTCKDEINVLESQLGLPISDLPIPVITKVKEVVKVKEIIKEIYIPKEIIKEIVKEVYIPGTPIVQEKIKEVYIYITFWDQIRSWFRNIF